MCVGRRVINCSFSWRKRRKYVRGGKEGLKRREEVGVSTKERSGSERVREKRFAGGKMVPNFC